MLGARRGGAAIAATAEAVRELCAHAREHKAELLDVFVTSPGRQADNATDLVAAVERAAGARVRVLSAEEEARLALAGAVATAAPTAPVVAVVDRFDVGKWRTQQLLAAALILGEMQRRLMVPFLVTEGSVREGALLAWREEAAA